MSCATLQPESIVQGALALIGRPATLITRLGDLYDILAVVLEQYQNRMAIHDGNFLLLNRRVTLPATRTEVSFTDMQWGRPVLCEVDPASLPTGTILPRRDVDLIGIQDAAEYRINTMQGGVGSANAGGNAATVNAFAQAVAWMRSADTIKLFFEFGGFVPGNDVTYRFFYEPVGGLTNVAEGQAVTWLPNFMGLLQADCALQFLPLTDIEEPQYSRLEKSLAARVMRSEPILDEYLQQNRQEQSGYSGGYARNRVRQHPRFR